VQLSFQQMLNDTPIKDVGDAELYGEAGGPQKKTGGADEANPMASVNVFTTRHRVYGAGPASRGPRPTTR